MDADFFKYGKKNLRFRKYPATCGRGLNHSQMHLEARYIWIVGRLSGASLLLIKFYFKIVLIRGNK